MPSRSCIHLPLPLPLPLPLISLSSPSRHLTHAPSPSTSCHLAHALPPSRAVSVMPFTTTLASRRLLSYTTPHTAFGKPPLYRLITLTLALSHTRVIQLAAALALPWPWPSPHPGCPPLAISPARHPAHHPLCTISHMCCPTCTIPHAICHCPRTGPPLALASCCQLLCATPHAILSKPPPPPSPSYNADPCAVSHMHHPACCCPCPVLVLAITLLWPSTLSHSGHLACASSPLTLHCLTHALSRPPSTSRRPAHHCHRCHPHPALPLAITWFPSSSLCCLAALPTHPHC